MAKNNFEKGKKPEISDKKGKDDKKKEKKLDHWSYYLAWFAFACAVGSAIIKVIKEWNPPDKDEHYK